MKRPQTRSAGARKNCYYWLIAPLCLVLAFQIKSTQQQQQLVSSLQQQQQAAGEQHNQQDNHNAAPMLSLGSESSSALESSAALAGDDLIAAESSPADAAEHKSFTSAQAIRQDIPQQMAASAAPVFVAPQAQQQQPQMFHPQHIAALRKPGFNPFMAAALAGNYGPAQQQIAAAAAAAAGIHPHRPQQQVVQQQQQQHGPHQHQMGVAPPQHHVPQMVNHAQAHQRPQQQQVAPVEAAQPMAIQESSVRNNVVPAPSNFNQNSMLDSNSIEMNDAPQQQQASTAMATASSAQHPVIAAASNAMGEQANWPLQAPDIPKIVSLEVKCEKNLMKVSIEFDKIFNGVIFSKGHYAQGQCLHVNQNSGKQQAYFDISINSCGTQGNTQNGLYGMGGNTGSGTYFENTIVIQYDPNVQEVYDHARKLRCTWHDQYEKAVTFRPFPVDMLDIVRADFAGDNVGCWMQIQVGRGPWASEVAGIVKIGQTMTMVLAIKDEENKFDMLVRNCFAHDGKRGPIELVDKSGCITRPKLMSKFTKIKNFGSSATVLSYAHFQAFKFPDSMEVHFQCTIQICRHQCPEQCSSGSSGNLLAGSGGEAYSESTISGTFNIGQNQQQAASQQQQQGSSESVHLRKMGAALSRERRDVAGYNNNNNGSHHHHHKFAIKPMIQNVGLNRMIQVVSAGDLAFAIQQQQATNNSMLDGTMSSAAAAASQLTRVDLTSQICMSSYNFVLSLVVLTLVFLCSCLLAVSLYIRQKSLAKRSNKLLVPNLHQTYHSPSASSSTCSSPSTTMRPQHNSVPQQQAYSNHTHHHHHHNNKPAY